MRVFADLGWFFRAHWVRYAVGIILLFLVEVLQLIPPWLIGQVVNRFVTRHYTVTYLWRVLAVILLAQLLSYALRYGWRLMLYGGSLELASELRRRLYRHFTELSPVFYQQHRIGDLMAHSTNDVQAVQETAGDGVLTLADSVLTAAVVVATMATRINGFLTLVALLPLPVMAYVVTRYGHWLHDRFIKAQAAFSDLNDRVQEIISGIRVVRAFGQETWEKHEFRDLSEQVMVKNIAVSQIDALFDPTVSVIVGLSYFLALAVGGWMVIHRTLNIGQLTTFTLYLGELIWPMMAFGFLFNIVERGRASYERIQRLLTEKPAIHDRPGAVDTLAPGPIHYGIPTFSYPGADHPVLQDVTLDIPAGAFVGILGRTGSGKSTLLRLLLREFDLTAGDITIAGTSIYQVTLRALRAQLAYVPQDHVIFSATVRDNIAFGYPQASLDEIVRVSRLAEIDEDIRRFPEGYDTLVGERGVTLSGGQQQRLSIARALLRPAAILVLDDALSAVDVQTEARILENLRHATQDRTLLLATHRVKAVEGADWVIVLDDGRVVESGSPSTLLARASLFSKMWQRQQLVGVTKGEDAPW